MVSCCLCYASPADTTDDLGCHDYTDTATILCEISTRLSTVVIHIPKCCARLQAVFQESAVACGAGAIGVVSAAQRCDTLHFPHADFRLDFVPIPFRATHTPASHSMTREQMQDCVNTRAVRRKRPPPRYLRSRSSTPTTLEDATVAGRRSERWCPSSYVTWLAAQVANDRPALGQAHKRGAQMRQQTEATPRLSVRP
jgi:hypothetical protein